MKGRPCIYRFTEPVLNNAVSDVIFAIFSDTISRGKLGPRETKKEIQRGEEREKEKDARLTSITSIPFCLLFITNLFSIRSFSVRGHHEKAGLERNIEGTCRMEKGWRTKARIVSPFFTNQKLRFDSDATFFFINFYITAQREGL